MAVTEKALVEAQEAVGPASTPIVTFRNVNKHYGSLHALRDINLDIYPGEVVVICGPSGSGKSTLLRCINKLEEVQSGQIVTNGTDLRARGKAITRMRADVGMVFQQFNLYPHLSVQRNITLAPTLVRKIPSKDAVVESRRLLARVGLAEKEQAYPGQLSGGQQQRVAIARSLAMHPKVMLFDEPTSALDPEMIQEVLDVMMSLARDGITMVAVTHEMGFARSVADRIVYMEDGAIVEEAPPKDFFTNSKSEKTQRFLSKIIKH